MRKKLLLVVDDRVVRRFVRKIARRLGFVVHVVDNGWDAVEAVCLKQYDLVMVKLELAGMSGLETVECIRTVQNKTGLREIPILGVAAEKTLDAVEKGFNLGINTIIRPLRLAEITSVLAALAIANSVSGVGSAFPAS